MREQNPLGLGLSPHSILDGITCVQVKATPLLTVGLSGGRKIQPPLERLPRGAQYTDWRVHVGALETR
jgi:hypothetical protein